MNETLRKRHEVVLAYHRALDELCEAHSAYKAVKKRFNKIFWGTEDETLWGTDDAPETTDLALENSDLVLDAHLSPAAGRHEAAVATFIAAHAAYVAQVEAYLTENGRTVKRVALTDDEYAGDMESEAADFMEAD